MIEHNAAAEKKWLLEGDGRKDPHPEGLTGPEESGDRFRTRATGARGGDEWSEAVILTARTTSRPCWRTTSGGRHPPYRIYKGFVVHDHGEDLDGLHPVGDQPRRQALRRIVNYPARGIGDTTVQRIADLAAQRGVSMWEAVDALTAELTTDPCSASRARSRSSWR